MYFKRLSMKGFRSFADPVTIDFARGITCIAGSTGSERSTISDALCWVLGEQSPYMLQSGKADEVLFSGTEMRKPAESAEVTLVMDRSGGLDEEPQEVSISRKMYRSGENEYRIDKKQCGPGDIRELITGMGIGVDGYSLIGQETISQLVHGGQKAWRDFLEEMAGTAAYRRLRADAELQLTDAVSRLEYVTELLQEQEQRIPSLTEEAEKAKMHMELKERFRLNEINVILKSIELSEKQTGILAKEHEGRQQQLEQIVLTISRLGEQIHQQNRKLQEMEQAQLKLGSERTEFQAAIEEHRSRIRLADEREASIRSKRKVFQDEMTRLSEKLEKEAAGEKQLQDSCEKLELAERTLFMELSEAEKALRTAEALCAENTRRLVQEQALLSETALAASSAEAQQALLQRDGALLEKRCRELENENSALSEALSCEAELSSAERTLGALQQRFQKEKLLWEETQYRKKEADAKLQALEQAHQKLVLETEKARTRTELLQNQEDSYESYPGAVQFLLRESGVKGMIGPVGELMKVTAGFEAAVNTALGPHLQAIVCRDDASAQEAVRVLTARKAGRLTFLPLQALPASSPRPEPSIAQEPGFAAIAADCVSFEEPYGAVAEHLLGTTVIVRSIRDAKAMSSRYPGLRYVTFDGESFDSDGSVAGGAEKNSTSRILAQKKQLYQAEAELHELKADQKNAQAALRKAADEQERLTQELQTLADRVKATHEELGKAGEACHPLRQKTAYLQEKSLRIARETEQHKELLRENRQQTEKLEQKKQDLDQKLRQLKRSTELFSAEKEKSRAAQEALLQQHNALQIQLESAKMKTAQIRELLSGCRRRMQEYTHDYNAAAQAEKEAALRQEQLAAQLQSGREALQVRESELFGFQEKFDEIRKEKIRLTAETDRLRSEKEALSWKSVQLRMQVQKSSLKAEMLRERVALWKNRLVDEFDLSFPEAMELKKKVFDRSEGIRESKKLKHALRELGIVNLNAASEAAAVGRRCALLDEEKQALTEAVDSLRALCSDTDVKIKAAFKSSFDAVCLSLSEAYRELSGGGRAELRMEDREHPLESVIQLYVMPPGKRMQSMSLLSGSEKDLAAAGLMIAVLKTKKVPFCILDGADKALDEADLARLVRYLKKNGELQFAAVTGKDAVMEYADALYEVTSPEQGRSGLRRLRDDQNIMWEEETEWH